MNITVSRTTRNIIDELFKALDSRQVKVLTKRYGLDDGEEFTLQKLGKLFGVTRERIRQIEASALTSVRKEAKSGRVNELSEAAVKAIEETGGVRKENHLLEKIKHFSDPKDFGKAFANHIRFLLEIADSALYHREDDSLHSHWHLSKTHQKKALDFLDELIKHLKDKKHETLNERRFHEFFDEVAKLHRLEKEVAEHYIHISKKFGKNIYGDFGLTDWPEVKPKVARDWIYLILKKSNKPLHFSSIAEEIRKSRLGKNTNTQTIHNELIKDKRFVLVGRGTYGLREWDDMPGGTIREVLVHILKVKGPLKPRDILIEVLKKRIFKENTILLNLQNKKYFERLEDGRYALKK